MLHSKLLAEDLSAEEIHQRWVKTLGKELLSGSTVLESCERFENGINGVLKTGKKITRCRDPNEKNVLLYSRELFTKVELEV